MENINKQLADTILSLNKKVEYAIISGSYVYNQQNAKYADIVIVSKQPISEELDDKLQGLGCDKIFHWEELDEIGYGANYLLAFQEVIIGDKNKLYSYLIEKLDLSGVQAEYKLYMNDSTRNLISLYNAETPEKKKYYLSEAFNSLFLSARALIVYNLIFNRLADANYSLENEKLEQFISIVDTCHGKYGVKGQFSLDNMPELLEEYLSFHKKVLSLS